MRVKSMKSGVRKTLKSGIEYEVGSGNVFADLGLPEASDLLVKARLTNIINEEIKRQGLTQAEAARITRNTGNPKTIAERWGARGLGPSTLSKMTAMMSTTPASG